MERSLALLVFLICSCRSTRADDAPRSIATTPIASTGPIARRFLATPGFSWHSFESRHIRLPLSADMATSRVGDIADSAESARSDALALLGEPDLDLCAHGYLHRFDLETLTGRQDHPGLLLPVRIAEQGRPRCISTEPSFWQKGA